MLYYSYVSAMVPVKSPKEYYVQQEVIVLFCETVERWVTQTTKTMFCLQSHRHSHSYTRLIFLPFIFNLFYLWNLLSKEEKKRHWQEMCTSVHAELWSVQLCLEKNWNHQAVHSSNTVHSLNAVILNVVSVSRALKLGYLTQDMIDDYEPALMFTIPRLAIVW